MSDAPQFLYRIQPARPDMLTDGPTQEETTVLSQHLAYLKSLAEEGTVIVAGRTQTTDESSFGIVLFEADSDEHAQSIMEHDPIVSSGVMHAELYPSGLPPPAANSLP